MVTARGSAGTLLAVEEPSCPLGLPVSIAAQVWLYPAAKDLAQLALHESPLLLLVLLLLLLLPVLALLLFVLRFPSLTTVEPQPRAPSSAANATPALMKDRSVNVAMLPLCREHQPGDVKKTPAVGVMLPGMPPPPSELLAWLRLRRARPRRQNLVSRRGGSRRCCPR